MPFPSVWGLLCSCLTRFKNLLRRAKDAEVRSKGKRRDQSFAVDTGTVQSERQTGTRPLHSLPRASLAAGVLGPPHRTRAAWEGGKLGVGGCYKTDRTSSGPWQVTLLGAF